MSALVAAVSTGCTSERPTGSTPSPGSSRSAPASSAPPTTPVASPTGPPAYGALVADRAQVHPGTISVTGARRGPADALVRYLQVRFAAYHRAELDGGALSSVARGSAAEQVRSYVESLQQQGHHTVGDVWVDIASVGMKGPSATLTSCLHNASADADRHNRVVERDLPPAYDVRATAVRGPRATWLIDTIRFDGRPRCGPG